MAIALSGVLLAAVACGGGGDKTVDLGDGNVTVGDDLPDSFPDDFPIYEGADLQNAIQGEQEGIEGLAVTWTTGDDLDDVTSFYEEALSDGPWKVVSNGTGSGTTYWILENSDTDQAGYVTLTDGDDVTILGIVGDNESASGDPSEDAGDSSGDEDDVSPEEDDSGADSGGDLPSELPDEVALSNDFPSDKFPLPDDISISSSSSVTSNGVQSHLVTFYSKDSIDDLATFFNDELAAKGYTQSIQTSAADGVYQAYSENADGTGAIIVVSIAEGDVEGYRQALLQITES
ncbi:MAG: hypothetical protein WEC75_11470 [Dehalococcoidia bacterium]